MNDMDAGQRRELRWSKQARDLVRASIKAGENNLSALLTQLVELSGNPRWACRRFARRMGLKSKRMQRAWSSQEQQRLLKLLDLHPVKQIATLMHRSESSVWHMLQRLGANAQMGKDSFTKHTLARFLHVHPDKIQDWIVRGWLKARSIAVGPGVRFVIESEEFCDFCKKHAKDVVGNRLSQERLDFVCYFVFPPSHAELLPVRESKKERDAFSAQMNEEEFDPQPSVSTDRSFSVEDFLDRTA
jgi:hypothetical protein